MSGQDGRTSYRYHYRFLWSCAIFVFLLETANFFLRKMKVSFWVMAQIGSPWNWIVDVLQGRVLS